MRPTQGYTQGMSHVALTLLHVYVALRGGAEDGPAAEAAETDAFDVFVALNGAHAFDFYVPQVEEPRRQ